MDHKRETIRLRVDCGPEFPSETFGSACKALGITVELSGRYDPRQTRPIERFIRQIQGRGWPSHLLGAGGMETQAPSHNDGDVPPLVPLSELKDGIHRLIAEWNKTHL